MWCVASLEASIKELISESAVTVQLEQAPELTQDMRILERWRTCIAYFITRHLLTHKLMEFSDKQLKATIEGPSPRDLHITFHHASERVPTLHLISDDGYAFIDQQIRIDARGYHSKHEVSVVDRIFTIVSMLREDFLKPGVLVVAGDEPNKSLLKDEVLQIATFVFGSKLHTKVIYANSDSDKEAIFGNPSSSGMGDLFQFVDSITNPIYNRHDHYGLVLVHANVIGQFILRELLENNDSKTHRTTVKKDRIMFVVVVEDVISPQLYSRAHLILKP